MRPSEEEVVLCVVRQRQEGREGRCRGSSLANLDRVRSAVNRSVVDWIVLRRYLRPCTLRKEPYAFAWIG